MRGAQASSAESPQEQQHTFQGHAGDAGEYSEEEDGALRASRPGVFMAVHSGAGRIGIAWYETPTGELKCMEAAEEGSGSLPYRMVQLARLHVLPSTIFVSSKAPEALIQVLRSPLGLGAQLPEQGTEGTHAPDTATGTAEKCEVRFERAKLFTADAARECLASVHVFGMPQGLSTRDRVHIVNTMVSLSREQQVCAAGALLSVLSRDGILAQPAGSGSTVSLHLEFMGEASLEGHLLVDPGSLEALGIFRLEDHPSAMGLGRAKEGLSVFGMLNRCVSPPGKRLLRLWFARPLVDAAALEQRLDGVHALAARPDEAKALKSLVRAVHDPMRLLARLQCLQSLPAVRDLMSLQESLAALLRIRDGLLDLISSPAALMNNPINSAANSIGPAGGAHHQSAGSGAAPSTGAPLQLGASCLFSRLASAMSDPLVAAHQLIAGVIDPGQVPEGMCVHYGVSQELDDMKALYFGLPDLLKEVEMYEVGRLPRSLAAAATGTWSVAYLPQLGFMLQIDTGLLKEDVLECLPDAELAFEGGVLDGEQVGACYHTATTRDLSERYGDVLLKIRDMETAVCNEVARRLGAHGGALRAAVATAAELDCLLSLAEAAVELRLSRPQLTSDNVLRIVGGRHILCQEIVPAGAEFIPNDTTMERDAARVHVITGPNFSGKSVYAKQVAIIVFLAHVGSFVPAEAAEVGLTDRIFTRVGTKECGAVPQSAFMIDLSQVAAMLRLATPRSLLIIDEFGKGTLASDGVGLLCGALGHLAARREPPKVILATHFSEVLDQQYLPRNPHLAFYTMAVLLHKEGEASDAWQWAGRGGGGSTTRSGLTFLYRLCQGQVGPSFGVECAKLAGVDGDVLKRAQHIIACAEAGRQVTRTSFRGMGARSAAFEGALAALLRVDASSIEDVRGLLGLVQAAMVQ